MIRKIVLVILLVSFVFIPMRIEATHTYPPYVRRLPVAALNLPVKFHKQERRLSCEAATLTMILNYAGINVTETDVVNATPVGPMGSDPDLVFVGDINGVQFVSGYGVHWDALANASDSFSPTDSFFGRDVHFLIDRLHDNKPVVIWGSFVRNPKPVSWQTPTSRQVNSWRGEHTFVVTGYAGPRRAPTHIFTIDPLLGVRVFRTGDFMRMWELFGNSGLFLN